MTSKNRRNVSEQVRTWTTRSATILDGSACTGRGPGVSNKLKARSIQSFFFTFDFFSLALFSSKIFCKIDTVVFSFVFDKYYPIID